MKHPRWNSHLAAFLAIFAAGPLWAAESMVALHGHVPSQVQSATLVGRAQADELVQLSLAVRLEQNLLDQTLEEIYGRNAPAQKHYLSSAEFAQRFGLAEKRQLLKDFALASGLTVDAAEDKPESMMVKVSGTANSVEKAFHVQLNHYQGTNGKTFRAHDTEPMIPASLAPHLGAVLGLSNITGIYRPHVQIESSASTLSSPALTGTTGPGGTLAPADIKTIYGLNQVTLTGAGQTIALLELDGYNPADIPIYTAAFGLPNTPVTFVGVDNTANLCGPSQNQTCNAATLSSDSGMVEVALDIDMVLALASGVSQVLVYTDINSSLGVYDAYNKIATDDIAQVVSTSWGIPELTAATRILNINGTIMSVSQWESQVFQRMAVQGQTIYAASGDSGAYDDGTTVSVDDPASQPFVTGVGGTSLAGSVSAPVETAWNFCGAGKCLQSSGGSSGGGVSAVWPIPGYQAGVSGLASQTARNVPDVSLNAAAPGYAVAVGGGFLAFGVGGTSAAAPLWGALTALINQQRVAAGKGSFGFANPALYQLGTSTSSAALFIDITTGSNGFYNAGVGYDNVTGWGSFKGSSLISAASGVPSAAFSNSLASVYAYPNPWDIRNPNITQRKVTITNLPDGATVKIFTLSGFWVKTLPLASGGSTAWDLTNDNGERVASGLYFYLATTPGATTHGEIAIIK